MGKRCGYHSENYTEKKQVSPKELLIGGRQIGLRADLLARGNRPARQGLNGTEKVNAARHATLCLISPVSAKPNGRQTAPIIPRPAGLAGFSLNRVVCFR